MLGYTNTKPVVQCALSKHGKAGNGFSDMQIGLRSVGNVTILKVQGRLDAETSLRAENLLAGLINRGETKIVIDLVMLQYINSFGLRVLASAAKRLKAAGGSLRIVSSAGKVREIFEISRSTIVFGVFENEDSALADF